MQQKHKMKKLTALAALVPALLGWSAAPVQNTAPPAKPAAEQPTGREIVDRFVKVTGADALVEKTSSIYVSGKIEAMGMKGSFERYAAKPSLSLMKSSIEGLGATAIGYDGTVAWMTNPMLSPMVLEGAERFQLVMQSSYDNALLPAKDYEKIELQGREQFEGHDCYKVLTVYRAPADAEEAKESEAVRTSTSWFDVESGLQIGLKTTVVQVGSSVPTTTVFSDYKKFGDYMFPGQMTQEAMGMKFKIIFDKVEYDKVDPKVFDVPESVRALIKDEKPVPAGSGAGG